MRSAVWDFVRGAFAPLMVIALVMAIFVGGMKLIGEKLDAQPVSAAAIAPSRQTSAPEQVEIFMSGVGDEGRTALMEKLDTWLNSHKGKVEVTGRTMSCNEHAIIASIWYKLKTD